MENIEKAISFFIILIVTISVGVIVIKQAGSAATQIELAPVNNTESLFAANGTTYILEQNTTGINNVTSVDNVWLDFNTTTSLIEVAFIDAINMSGDEMAISVWINASFDGDGLVASDIMGNLWQSAEGYRWTFRGDLETDYRFVLDTFNNTYVCDPTLSWGADEWHHISMSYNSTADATNLSIYFDGVFNTHCLVDGNINSSEESLIIGASNDGGTNDWDGAMDEIRIYNRSLTEADLVLINNSGRIANSSLTSDGLVLWYSLNEQSGLTTHDLSSSYANGTTTGSRTGWLTDSVTSQLTQNEDYTVSNDNFVLTNFDKSWTAITADYPYTRQTTNASGSITRIIGMLVAIAFLILIASFVIKIVRRDIS